LKSIFKSRDFRLDLQYNIQTEDLPMEKSLNFRPFVSYAYQEQHEYSRLKACDKSLASLAWVNFPKEASFKTL
jgi:hypothetical protein